CEGSTCATCSTNCSSGANWRVLCVGELVGCVAVVGTGRRLSDGRGGKRRKRQQRRRLSVLAARQMERHSPDSNWYTSIVRSRPSRADYFSVSRLFLGVFRRC